MREVARSAGVSVSTVGNVLNNPAVVAADTRTRVEAAMRQVGFIRSLPARQLRGLPSHIVGAVTLDAANPFYAALNRGLADRLHEAGCVVLTCSTDAEVDREAEALGTLQEHAVRGIVITPTECDVDQLTEISRRGTPVVLVDCARGRLDLCAVTVDHVLGGQLVGEHLLGLGHRRIAFLKGTVEISPVTDRYEGLRRAVLAARLDPAEVLLDAAIPPPDLMEGAAAAVAGLAEQRDRPTAIACLNDVAALGVMRGLDRLGLRIPDDVSVVGYDDLVFAAQLRPALTTIGRPTYQLGVAAAELLLDEASPTHRHREIRFQPILVARASTGPPR
jgi:LacI family transcriptional regulator